MTFTGKHREIHEEYRGTGRLLLSLRNAERSKMECLARDEESDASRAQEVRGRETQRTTTRAKLDRLKRLSIKYLFKLYSALMQQS